MINFINDLNAWYDRLPSTPRFLLLLVAVLGALLPMNLGASFGYPSVFMVGALWFGWLLVIGSFRAVSLGGFHKYLGAFLFLYAAAHVVLVAFMFYWWVQ